MSRRQIACACDDVPGVEHTCQKRPLDVERGWLFVFEGFFREVSFHI